MTSRGSALLAEARRRHPGLRLLRTRQVFEMLLAAVLEQKVTGKQARQSWRWMLAKYGEPAPGPAPAGMRVFPAPDGVAAGAVMGLAPRPGSDRSAPTRSCARSRWRHPSSEPSTTAEGGRSVERKLRSDPRGRRVDAAETMQRAHGDPDSPSVGDYHLPKMVGWTLIGKPVDDDGMLELLEPWRGHRQRIMRLIELVGVLPRFATADDHRGSSRAV